jgi:hypothetical protein
MITFTRRSPVYDASSDTSVIVETTITGNAMQVRGDPRRYKALGLTLLTMPTLLFTPTDYEIEANGSDFVQPGDTVVWTSRTFTVKDVDPIAPDGVVIASRIVIGL